MTVKMEDIKKVREITSAGMSSCKDALIKANGSVFEAVRILNKEGLASSNARSNKPTSEGRVFIKNDKENREISIYSVKCETDFVANSSEFKAIGLSNNLNETIDKLKISMRENIKLGELSSTTYNENDIVASYIHYDGKSGSVVIIANVDDDKVEQAKQFAYDTCLHIVAFAPTYATIELVPSDIIEEKREIFLAQINNDDKIKDKPDNVKERILNGKIRKAICEMCLMEQNFVKDDKHTVFEVMNKECGNKARIVYDRLITL